jgi:flavorubredoxin
MQFVDYDVIQSPGRFFVYYKGEKILFINESNEITSWLKD